MLRFNNKKVMTRSFRIYKDTEKYLDQLGVKKWEEHSRQLMKSPGMESSSKANSRQLLGKLGKEYSEDYKDLQKLVKEGILSEEDKILASHFISTTKLELAADAGKVEEDIKQESSREPGIATRVYSGASSFLSYLGSMLYGVYEFGWSLVKFILYHPLITNVILRMFLFVKKKICESFYGDITEELSGSYKYSFKDVLGKYYSDAGIAEYIQSTLFGSINDVLNSFGSMVNACEHALTNALTYGFSWLGWLSGKSGNEEVYGWLSGTLVWNGLLYKTQWHLGTWSNWMMAPVLKDKLTRLFLMGCKGFLNFGECGVPPLIGTKRYSLVNINVGNDDDDFNDMHKLLPSLSKLESKHNKGVSLEVTKSVANDIIVHAKQVEKESGGTYYSDLIFEYGVAFIPIVVELVSLGFNLPDISHYFRGLAPDAVIDVVASNPKLIIKMAVRGLDHTRPPTLGIFLGK